MTTRHPLIPRRRVALAMVAGLSGGWALGAKAQPSPPKPAARPAGTHVEIKWDDLVPKGWDPMKGITDPNVGMMNDSDPKVMEMMRKLREAWDNAPIVPALDGASVKLPGYLVPLDESKQGLAEFLLVPYFGACIHTPPPPSNQIVHVIAKTPAKVRTMEPVWVRGVLKTERNASAMGTSSYRLEAVGVEPYSEKLR